MWFLNYSAIKKNAFDSVLMRWVNLEPIIQSEESQKEKYEHHILTHNTLNPGDSTDECICRAGWRCRHRGQTW